jgi:hypothetical protein
MFLFSETTNDNSTSNKKTQKIKQHKNNDNKKKNQKQTAFQLHSAKKRTNKKHPSIVH